MSSSIHQPPSSSSASTLKRSNAKISQVLSRSSLPLFSSPILLPSSSTSLASVKSNLARYKKEMFIVSKPNSNCTSSNSNRATENKMETTSKEKSRDIEGKRCQLQQQQQQIQDKEDEDQEEEEKPFVEIVEQPAILRSSYHEVIGASCSSYPSIRVRNNAAPSSLTSSSSSKSSRPAAIPESAVVVVSCVTSASPFRVHPSKLCWKENGQTEKGVVSATFNSSEQFSFQGLIVEQAKRSGIRQSLEERQSIRVDPFRQGFDMEQAFDLSEVRLCFQVFLKYHDGSLQPLQPAVSDPLKIIRLRRTPSASSSAFHIGEISDRAVPASGQKRVVLACEKLEASTKQGEFEVRLEQKGEKGARIWSHVIREMQLKGNGCASFVMPAYRDVAIKKEVTVKLYLYRVADKKYSKSVTISYLPVGVTVEKDDDEDDEEVKSNSDKKRSLRSRDDQGLTENNNGQQQQQLPKVGESFSIADMPRGSSGEEAMTTRRSVYEDEDDDDEVVVLPDSPDERQSQSDMDPRVTSLRSSLSTLTKALNAEREANRYLSQRSVSLQKHQDELRHLKVGIQQELDASKIENAELRGANAGLTDRLADAEQEVTEWRRGANEERIIRHLQEEGRDMRRQIEQLKETVQRMEAEAAERLRGVDNLRWQLRQKETQVRALETRLEETFPGTATKRSVTAAASFSAVAGEEDREGRDSSPSITSSNGSLSSSAIVNAVLNSESPGLAVKRRRINSTTYMETSSSSSSDE